MGHWNPWKELERQTETWRRRKREIWTDRQTEREMWEVGNLPATTGL